MQSQNGGPVSAADRVASVYGRQIDILESDLVRLVEAMPADRFDFPPADGAAIVLEERSPYGPGKNDNGPDDIEGKAAILVYLKGSIGYARKGVIDTSECGRPSRSSPGKHQLFHAPSGLGAGVS